MLYYSTLLAALISAVFSGPLSSCYDQVNCLDLSVTELAELDDDGKVQYELCLIFDDTLADCDKEDDISHACTAGTDELADEKTEGWSAGSDNGLCDTASCGDIVSFGIKDGKSCTVDQFIYANFSLPDYDQLLMCYDEYSCGSQKQSKACRWAVPAPECEGATTTEVPGTTAADEPGTTEVVVEGTTAEPVDCESATCGGYNEGQGQECNDDPCCEFNDVLLACTPIPQPSNTYRRDRATDENDNFDFVTPDEILEEDATTSVPGEEGEDSGNLVSGMVAVFMAIFGCLW